MMTTMTTMTSTTSTDHNSTVLLYPVIADAMIDTGPCGTSDVIRVHNNKYWRICGPSGHGHRYEHILESLS